MSAKPHGHYFRDCPYPQIDIYRVLQLFGVTDPCLQHAAKKILVAGGRGGKDIGRDVQEAIDTLARWQEMRREEAEPDQVEVLRAGMREHAREAANLQQERNILREILDEALARWMRGWPVLDADMVKKIRLALLPVKPLTRETQS
jgi:hypothetical protein